MVQHILTNEFEKLSLFMHERAEEKEKGGGHTFNTHFVETECIRIRTSIRSSVLSFGDDRARAAIYIEYITGELILLSDFWYNNTPLETKPDNGGTNRFRQLVSALLSELNKLLLHLIESYPAYFNKHSRAPAAFRNLYRDSITEPVEVILCALKRGKDVALFSLLDTYLHSLQRKTEFRTETFYQLDYLQDFVNALHGLIRRETEDLEKEIYKELVLLNFNHPHAGYLYITKVKREYEQAESYQEEILEAAAHLRILQQYPPANRPYNPSAEPLKEILVRSFSEEIKYIQQMQDLDLHGPANQGPVVPRIFFTVSITLEQLLFLFRLLIETGIVIIKRKSDLYDFIHLHIGTEERKTFSRGSLRNAFGSRKQATAKKVKEILMEMMRLINQKYLAPAGIAGLAGLLF